MKRSVLLITLLSLLTLSFCSAYAQNAITVDDVVGKYGMSPIDTVKTGTDIMFKLRYVNGTGANVNISNGYEIYSPDGATWSGPVAGDTLTGAIPRSNWDLNFAMNLFTGVSRDTLGIIAAKISSSGMPIGFNGVPYGIKIGQFDESENDLHICIDSAWFRPGGTWKWAATGVNAFPTWGGPYCYLIYLNPPMSPEITNCPPTGIEGSHCATFTYDFNAVFFEGSPATFELVSGPGTINATTGVWTWNSATIADVGTSVSIVVRPCDPYGCGPDCTVPINVTNEAPVITCPPTALMKLGTTASFAVTATDACHDPLTYSILAVTPAFVGAISINPNSGVITASPVTPSNEYDIVVSVSDGNLSAQCNWQLKTFGGCPFSLQISKEHDVIQGGYWTVPVNLVSAWPGSGLGGFNILIAYDNSALSFQNATLGAPFGPAGCGWEYFTYRFGPDGNCGGGCPSGMIRIVGMAETNNGANHPDCFLPATLPATLFNLNFLVSNDRTLECQYVPIRFYWLACGDNTLSNTAGDELYISCSVADFENTLVNIGDPNVGFPTYLGAQATCDVSGGEGKPSPIRAIDFINGGIDIVCADSIDLRGDINLNGLANEIADAVNFTNYFIKGLAAFTINLNGQIAASDVNADGIALSVADLVYMIRIIVGDAQPYAKIAPVAATYTIDNGVISVDGTMGAAYLLLVGDAQPELLANNMLMQSEFDGANTRVLVYPDFGSNDIKLTAVETFSGTFLNTNGAEVLSIELATADGNMVVARELPSNFGLSQNYPNPFNPTTTISFLLPVSSDWTLTITNIVGQVIATQSGYSEAGETKVTVDASNWASGLYFYSLKTGDFANTKKMMLVR